VPVVSPEVVLNIFAIIITKDNRKSYFAIIVADVNKDFFKTDLFSGSQRVVCGPPVVHSHLSGGLQAKIKIQSSIISPILVVVHYRDTEFISGPRASKGCRESKRVESHWSNLALPT